ncbi:MAG: hypothetical protein IPI82_09045 [Candidatus Microthrix sp.]|nr:hypothetical protein [Candidatus Microthrix sp.]MBK7322585.1 hypothetical protein [Candidatus Microthrix sp.]
MKAPSTELATHVRDLLETAVIPNEDQAGETRALRPDDVAVLIAANREGPVIRDALMALGIPAVIARGENVLESEASTHFHRLLAAVARPSNVRRARAAGLSWFFGWDAGDVAAATDAELSAVQVQLHTWGETLSGRGVAAFVGQVWAETSVASRVLALPDGDRSMTDLDHIAELLSLSGGRQASPSTLLNTFEALSGGSDDGNPEADLAARRVESDSRAVQIMTTFVAKGLEYPVVCCTSLWFPSGAKAKDNIWWDTATKKRTIDVATKEKWGPDDERRPRAAGPARKRSAPSAGPLRGPHAPVTTPQSGGCRPRRPGRQAWPGSCSLATERARSTPTCSPASSLTTSTSMSPWPGCNPSLRPPTVNSR